MNTRSTVIMTVLMMLFSSMAGCLDRSEDDETEALGNAMVSTYHVGQLVSAIGGDTINVDLMSPSNVPVHDYEPSATDIVRMQESDIFFYHGLNLEPWVDDALASLGDNAPTSIQTHAMPTGEDALDYKSMLISDLCDLLTNGPFESTTLGHDEHEFGQNNDTQDNHTEEDEHDHEGHHHAEAEETIENAEGCPTDTVISIFHMEEGEHVLEFEEDHNDDFNMAVLKMPGGHAHHHHGHGAGAFEWAGVFEISDNSHTWSMQKVDGGYADPLMRIVIFPTSTPNEEAIHASEGVAETMIEGDSCTVVEDGESITPIAAEGSCFELHVGTGDDSTYAIDTTGLTGITVFAQHVPTEFERDQHYLKDSAGADIEPVVQEGADAHAHDDHDDDHDDHEDHGGVCHNTTTHENYESTEADCEAAGHMWDEEGDHGGVCHNTTTHENYESTEADCEAAGHTWMEGDHHDYPEVHADYNAHSLSFPEEEDHSDEGVDSGEEDHHEPGYAVVHIEEEGDYGFAVPKDVEFYILADAPKAYEWAGVFPVVSELNTWSMQKVDGDYADPSMRIVVFPAPNLTEEAIHLSESSAEELIEGDSCISIGNGQTMEDASFSANGTCFELQVAPNLDDSIFNMDLEYFAGVSGVVIYAQHVPTEFERDQHYLKDSAGADIEPVVQEISEAHDHGHHDEHGDEGGIEAGEGEEEFNYDPHSWLDPLAFKQQAQVVLEALKVAFPSGEDDFTSNAESYMAQLDSLHADFQTTLPSDSTCTETKVIANHNAYSYMAKRYDLRFISIHGLDPEGEPSAADISEAVEEINEEGITVLFVEEFTSVSAVDSIVEQTTSDTMPNGVSVEYLYTMELPPKDSTDDYISLMRKSLESLKVGLGC